MEKHHRATRHYLSNYMLLLVVMVHAKGQLRVSKLKTYRLKAKEGILTGSLSLWNHKVNLWKHQQKTPKCRNPFAIREQLSFIEISQLCMPLTWKIQALELVCTTTLDFTVKGITNQLDLTWIWYWWLLRWKRILCRFYQGRLGKKKKFKYHLTHCSEDTLKGKYKPISSQWNAQDYVYIARHFPLKRNPWMFPKTHFSSMQSTFWHTHSWIVPLGFKQTICGEGVMLGHAVILRNKQVKRAVTIFPPTSQNLQECNNYQMHLVSWSRQNCL